MHPDGQQSVRDMGERLPGFSLLAAEGTTKLLDIPAMMERWRPLYRGVLLAQGAG
jgi:hypothetical protein